jgi:NAD(P)-dependent dehydrogenase (short-subunit alcohol dehydrogenase family)
MASLGGAGESVAVVVGAGELGSATATLLAAYSLGKAVLSHVVRILDLELRPHGIGGERSRPATS